MSKEAESKALHYLHGTTTKGRIHEHRILYESSLPSEEVGDAISFVALELGQEAYMIFSITKRPVDEASYGDPIYQFVALFSDRNQAVQAVFNLTAHEPK
jgi:hypothetical protein